MATQRRVATPLAPPPPPVEQTVNLLDLSMYAGDFLLAKGDYVLYFEALMFKGEKSTQAERLGIMISAYPLATPTEEHRREQFYSMGSKAHLSFQPNASNKGLVPVPGGPGTSLPPSTNWGVFLKSLHDSGLPDGLRDLAAIDGVHVHIEHMDEPEERAGFKSATGEAPTNTGPRKIAVVSEILESGRPWEGTGGIPAAGLAVQAAPPQKVNGAPRPSAIPAPRTPTGIAPVTAAAQPAATEASEEILVAATSGFADVLDKAPEGLPWLQLRNAAFTLIKANNGDDMAQAVAEAIFTNEAVTSNLLGQLGYSKQGSKVIPIPLT